MSIEENMTIIEALKALAEMRNNEETIIENANWDKTTIEAELLEWEKYPDTALTEEIIEGTKNDYLVEYSGITLMKNGYRSGKVWNVIEE